MALPSFIVSQDNTLMGPVWKQLLRTGFLLYLKVEHFYETFHKLKWLKAITLRRILLTDAQNISR